LLEFAALRSFDGTQAPGFFEADLVAHCGESMEGFFLNTLVLTDIATGWTECVALLLTEGKNLEGEVVARTEESADPGEDENWNHQRGFTA
jgi:hypothetical protein